MRLHNLLTLTNRSVIRIPSQPSQASRTIRYTQQIRGFRGHDYFVGDQPLRDTLLLSAPFVATCGLALYLDTQFPTLADAEASGMPIDQDDTGVAGVGDTVNHQSSAANPPTSNVLIGSGKVNEMAAMKTGWKKLHPPDEFAAEPGSPFKAPTARKESKRDGCILPKDSQNDASTDSCHTLDKTTMCTGCNNCYTEGYSLGYDHGAKVGSSRGFDYMLVEADDETKRKANEDFVKGYSRGFDNGYKHAYHGGHRKGSA